MKFLKACKLFKVQCFDQKMFACYSIYQRVDNWTLLVRAQLGCVRRVPINTTLRIMHFALVRSYAACTGWLLCMHRSAFLLAPGDTKSLPDACDQHIAARKLRERRRRILWSVLLMSNMTLRKFLCLSLFPRPC